MTDFDLRLRARIEDIAGRDKELAREFERVRKATRVEEGVHGRILESMRAGRPGDQARQLTLETIVLATGRPVLAIVKNEAQLGELAVKDPDSQVWKKRLADARKFLLPAIRAVGRIELARDPRYQWVGTGWLVAEDVVVTNRHVAAVFGRQSGDTFVFRPGVGGQVRVSVDFLEEVGSDASLAFQVERILDIADEDGPDMALLKLKPTRGRAACIGVADTEPRPHEQIAAIGYPARDSRIPDYDLMERIFGDVYDKKRLAPGQVTTIEDGSVLHDCSTLGGNSGSVLLSLASGKAVGLHYAGVFLQTNYAVPGPEVRKRMAQVLEGARSPRAPRADDKAGDARPPQRGVVAGRRSDGASERGVTLTIPIRVQIDVGDVTTQARVAVHPVVTGSGSAGSADGDVEAMLESAPEDYADREGYKADFLGDDIDVARPEIVKRKSDVLTFEADGGKECLLSYRHFSLVMSRSRRLCIFSAANVDGKRSKKMKRPGWRIDPRIPRDAQILGECYGNAPKFSRGHMTRREDPVWGTERQATVANADSMHVTNTVPQMQPFNAGIWLGLEDYALQNAREDDMKICVFTGPFLEHDDPEMFGILIPRSFWKVIAFVHDETGKLCATGYSMSQESYLSGNEFVFGQHDTSQVAISWIEKRAGLSFGTLADVDPLREAEEAVPAVLTDYSQIRFV